MHLVSSILRIDVTFRLSGQVATHQFVGFSEFSTPTLHVGDRWLRSAVTESTESDPSERPFRPDLPRMGG